MSTYRRRALALHASALAIAAGLAAAPAAHAAEAAAAATEVATVTDEVIVTGTRLTGVKAVDSPAPVVVVASDTLKRVGQPDLVQSLAQNMPSIQAQTSGGNEESFNLTLKLRGLSPNHTLVLVNGKRRHGTSILAVSGGPYGGGAAADLAYIPVASIDHVEVLQDGAAAQYGTDAIAGVINIILKKNVQGGSLSYTGGQYIDGGGLTSDLNGTIGFRPTDKAFLDLSFESKFKGTSFRGDVDARGLNTGTPANVSANILGKYPTITQAADYPYINRIEGDGQLQLGALTYNGGYELSPDVQLYSFGTIGYKYGRHIQNVRLPNVVLGGAGQVAVPFPQGFSPTIQFRETDYAATAGAKGALAGTTWDLSSTYGRSYSRVYVTGAANASWYATHGSTPRDFHDGDLTATQWTNNLDLTHEFPVGLAKPLVLAGGAEYRIDSYELKAGDPASYFGTGAQSYFGYAPSNAGYHQRTNYSFYADGSLNPVTALKVDAAVRYENYSDFGDTTVAKLTGRYDFNDAFAVRATGSTGFRAPTLAEEYYSGINVSPTSVSGVFAPNSAGAHFLGVNGLKPEKSTNVSVGVVTHLLPGLTTTVDAYSIKITDRIVQSGTFYGYNANKNVVTSPSILQALAANGVAIDPAIFTLPSGSVGVQTFVNGADTQTYGVDFLATLPVSYGSWGHVDYSLTANYNDTRVTRVLPPPSNVSSKVTLLDLPAISNIEDSTPKWRATFGAYWSLGKFGVNVRESIYGSSFVYIQDPVAANFDQIKVNLAAITDLEASYEIIRGVKISAGANNLFNVYPTKDPAVYRAGLYNTNASGYASSVYPGNSPFGYNGGFYYGKVTWSF
ncbi:MAG: TonB-dependent receptor plug domain-containing protein [Phenylobacterium sp.]